MQTEDRIKAFLTLAFPNDFTPKRIPKSERAVVASVLGYVDERVSQRSRPQTYVLGLAIDFAMLAQRLSAFDKGAKKSRLDLTETELFERYTLIKTRGGAKANTLTLEYHGASEGIRRIEERLVDFFHSLNRSGYPSAYVYNTGQWHKYKDLLVLTFQLSESGRYRLCRELIDYAFKLLPIHEFSGRTNKRIRLFEQVLSDYPRSDPNENGGLLFQGIANGFISADRPHLNIIADKVRTGSARQKRFGDIDCYRGLDIELSVEVKDISITERNFDRQLASFVNEVVANRVLGMAFVQEIDSEARQKLTDSGIIVLTLAEVSKTVATWDWAKQDNAVQAMLHHISHVEQNVHATQRMLKFIAERDPGHDSLIYAEEEKSNNS